MVCRLICCTVCCMVCYMICHMHLIPRLHVCILHQSCNCDTANLLQMWLRGELSNQRLREAFDEIDADGNGKLDLDQISAALTKLGKSKKQVQAALTEWGIENADGVMSFEEVLPRFIPAASRWYWHYWRCCGIWWCSSAAHEWCCSRSAINEKLQMSHAALPMYIRSSNLSSFLPSTTGSQNLVKRLPLE